MAKVTRIAAASSRWAARVLGVLLVALVVVFMLGEGVPPLVLQTILFWACLAGLIVALRWEGIGGLLALAGMAGFYAINYIFAGRLPRGPFFPLFLVASVLYLVSWSLHHVPRHPHGPSART